MRLNAFGHDDADIGFDPLSANRRFVGTADLAVLGTLVFAGPTRDSISVMVPDCIVPPVSGTVRVNLRHHVGLSLGPAVDMTNWSPEDNLERALYPASLADTLGLQRRAYWDEVNPLLKKWKNVNNTNCQTFTNIRLTWAAIFVLSTRPTYVFGDVRSSVARFGSPPSLMPRTTSREFTSSRRVMEPPSTSASGDTG